MERIGIISIVRYITIGGGLLKKLLLIVFLLTLLTACTSTKFDSLTEQARNHYYSGEYEDAAAVYEKALNIREDAEIRKLLSNSKKESELLNYHEEFKRKLRGHSKSLQNISVYSELEKVCSEIVEDVTFYSSIEANNDLREAKKINAVQGELFLEVILLDASSPYMYKLSDGTVYDFAQRLKKNIENVLSKAK